MTIQDIVLAKGIQFLFHFTRLENLAPIMQHGLLTRTQCGGLVPPVVFNDAYRHDHTDAVSATISFPNYKVFWPFRQNSPGQEWIVIALAPHVMWETRCAFCKENAASGNVTAIPIEQRMGPDSLTGMFEDFGGKTRAELNIPNNYPTNPQAEVLLLDGVPVQRIIGVAVATQALKDQLAQAYPGFQIVLNPSYFSYRQDWAHWQN